MIDSMEIFREYQAPSTESSYQPPPIHLSFPLIAPPSPPSNLEQPTKIVDGRQILKPVEPSKPKISEKPPKISGENYDIANAFLPQELAEIIATRQRLIPRVPSYIRKEQGDLEANIPMLADDDDRVCSVRPAHLKLYGRKNTEAPHRTWMAFFSKGPRPGLRVFDESGVVRPFKKQQSLEFFRRCNGHHPTKNCFRAPSCGNCGFTNHSEDIYMATTKCRNCGGSHRSHIRRCLARPTRLAYRQADEREYKAILRARAAEVTTASTEDANIEIINSQFSETKTNFENSQASSVVQSASDALCL
ncbi:hypothetical protein EPUL_005853 [Erysiphe pulchra]|uniref:Uncharacterized protein n=1 Tax=Erysiphe pulchra TaxID=225359 RepID=A0A2S4PLU2_9PEZI|nr:hypothetical protein EPUL_005853 [Erysiphe pulchra]